MQNTELLVSKQILRDQNHARRERGDELVPLTDLARPRPQHALPSECLKRRVSITQQQDLDGWQTERQGLGLYVDPLDLPRDSQALSSKQKLHLRSSNSSNNRTRQLLLSPYPFSGEREYDSVPQDTLYHLPPIPRPVQSNDVEVSHTKSTGAAFQDSLCTRLPKIAFPASFAIRRAAQRYLLKLGT